MERKSVVKRILSAAAAVLVAVSCFPAVELTASAVTPKNKIRITSEETFEYLIEKVESETSAYIASRLRLLIYGDDTSNIYYVGESFPSSSSYQTLKDGEIGQSISLRSAQCYAYAEWAYYKYFGASRYAGGGYVEYDKDIVCNETNLRKAVADAKCGAHIRIAANISGYQHSISFVTTDETGEGFYYLEGTSYSGVNGYVVCLSYVTYKDFADAYAGKKINFVQLPEEYPECDEDAQLTIYDAKVPVNVQKGKSFDVIGTIVMSDCDITSVTAGVYTQSGTKEFEVSATPNCGAFRFGKLLDGDMLFSKLDTGTYVYRLTAEDESGAEVELEKQFTVSSSASSYITETVYSYAMSPLDKPEYYEAPALTEVYTLPDEDRGEVSELKSSTVVEAVGTYTAADGTVWLNIGSKQWIKKEALTAHKHSLSETGLCTAEGCEYDATPEPTAMSSTSFAAISATAIMSRPYDTESQKLSTLAANSLITVTGKVTNVNGETWYRTGNGYVPASAVDTISGISVASMPNKTEYYAGDSFVSTGLKIKVRLTGGKSFETSDGMTFSYNFSTAGISKVTVTYGGKQTSFTCTVKPVAGKETWKVTTSDGDNLNIRTGPGTNYGTAGKYADGTVVTITDIVSSDGDLWGETDEGWIALEYCTYVSGYMYEIRYDLNGGDGDRISSTYKRYGQSVTLSNIEPELDGYVFLGWATDDEATEAQYAPGDTYKADSPVTLYAVWSRNVYITGEVSVSGTPAYGNVLNLDASMVKPAGAEYRVEWIRIDDNGETVIGTGSTYTPTAADINCDIAVRIIGINDYVDEIVSEFVTVTKKEGEKLSAPAAETITSTSIELRAVSGAEYSLNNGPWQTSPVFDGLTPDTSYTVRIRAAETATSFAGTASSATFRTNKKVPDTLTSSKFTVNTAGKTVSGISAGFTADRFLEAFGEEGYISLVTAEGQAVEGDVLVGTGMKVVLSDGDVVSAEYTVMVTGDVSGDGKINISDMVAIQAHILGKETLSGFAATAGDINGDGKINISDMVALQAHILGKEEVKPRAV